MSARRKSWPRRQPCLFGCLVVLPIACVVLGIIGAIAALASGVMH